MRAFRLPNLLLYYARLNSGRLELDFPSTVNYRLRELSEEPQCTPSPIKLWRFIIESER
jgi:hypothetical protein